MITFIFVADSDKPMKPRAFLLILCAGLAGCASTKPVLYTNDHYKAVGKEAAERDIEACIKQAEAAGAGTGTNAAGQTAARTAGGAAIGAASGAVGGAIFSSAASGSVWGAASGATAGLLSSIFSKPQPNPAYQNFVNQCLTERGYQPVGWK
jgi:hypothetical protein